ncbi:MAG: class I SAM-dependent methyltransferase [Bacillota bacterium]
MEKVAYLDLLAQYEINSAHPGGMALTRELLRRETITSNTTVLDVGCGTGQTSSFIARRYPCQVVAIDINPRMLEKARQKFSQSNLKIPVFRADAADLPFRKNSFDLVLAESVTVFTNNIRRTLREYYRVLKPGGTLLAIEGTALLPLTAAEEKDLRSMLGIACLPTKDQWRQMLQEAGFRNIQVLFQQRMSWLGSFPPELAGVFSEYRRTMFRNRNKFGFGVYRCQL